MQKMNLNIQKRFSLEKMSQKNISKVVISHFAKATASQIGHKGCCVEIHFLHDFGTLKFNPIVGHF